MREACESPRGGGLRRAGSSVARPAPQRAGGGAAAESQPRVGAPGRRVMEGSVLSNHRPLPLRIIASLQPVFTFKSFIISQ